MIGCSLNQILPSAPAAPSPGSAFARGVGYSVMTPARVIFAIRLDPYSLNHKLLFSNVNLREVNHMCPFNSASFPDSLALASEDTLIIGTIDEIQKLHIRTVPLGEQPRRIAHQDSTRTFLVGGLKPSAGGGAMSDAEEVMACSLRLLDDQTFDTRSTFPLGANEDFTAVLSTLFAEDTRQYFVVGTAFILPDEPEPSSGRLLVFAVEEGALVLKVCVRAHASHRPGSSPQPSHVPSPIRSAG